MCVLKFLSLGYNLVLWYELNKMFWDILLYFLIRSVYRGNQHGGREYDDLQKGLDMTSHKNPLFSDDQIIEEIRTYLLILDTNKERF